MNRNIHILHNSETLMFAAGELAKYLRLLSDTPVTCTIGVVSKVNPSEITLGLYGNGLGVSPSNAHPFDDAVTVDIINGKGFIAGINERSVLLGVYRFLQELGCRWVRPGIYGEYVPRIDITKATVHLEKKASFRHRTICIEGSVSVENVLVAILS